MLVEGFGFVIFGVHGDLAHHKRVLADDLLVSQCVRRFGLPVLMGVADEETVQRFLAAIKIIRLVPALQLLNSWGRHYMPPRSNTLGSLRSLARRRNGRGGASSASLNASHCALFKPKR